MDTMSLKLIPSFEGWPARRAREDRLAQVDQEIGSYLDTADRRRTGPCPCVCNSGGFCGGCGHAGCGGR